MWPSSCHIEDAPIYALNNLPVSSTIHPFGFQRAVRQCIGHQSLNRLVRPSRDLLPCRSSIQRTEQAIMGCQYEQMIWQCQYGMHMVSGGSKAIDTPLARCWRCL